MFDITGRRRVRSGAAAAGVIALVVIAGIVLVFAAWLFAAWGTMVTVGVVHGSWWRLVPTMSFHTARSLAICELVFGGILGGLTASFKSK